MLVLRKVQKLFLAAVGIVIADLQLYQSFQHSLGLDGMVGAVVFGIAALLVMPALSLLGYQRTHKTSNATTESGIASGFTPSITEDENITFDKILKKADELNTASSKWQPATPQVASADGQGNDASALMRLRHCVAYVTCLTGMSQNPKAPSSITSNLSAGVHLRVATEMQNLFKLAMLKQGVQVTDEEAARVTQEDLDKMASTVSLSNSSAQHQDDDPESHLADELKKLFKITESQSADFKNKLKKFNADAVKDVAHWKGFKPIWEWFKSLFKAVAFTAAVTAPLVATGVMMDGFQNQTNHQVSTHVANTPVATVSSPSCEGSTFDPIADRQQFDQQLQNEFQQLANNANQDVNAVKALSPEALQNTYPAIARKMCSMSNETQPPVTLIPTNPEPSVDDTQPNHSLKPKIPLTSLPPSRPTNKRPSVSSVDRPTSQPKSEGDPSSQRATGNRMPYGSRPLKMTPLQDNELEYSLPYNNNDSGSSSPDMGAQVNHHNRAVMDSMSSLRQRQTGLYNGARQQTADVNTNRAPVAPSSPTSSYNNLPSTRPTAQVPNTYTALPPTRSTTQVPPTYIAPPPTNIRNQTQYVAPATNVSSPNTPIR